MSPQPRLTAEERAALLAQMPHQSSYPGLFLVAVIGLGASMIAVVVVLIVGLVSDW